MEMDSYSFDELYCERPKNDVFLNYLFGDIGKSFVSHLKGGLTRNCFTVFDHTMLPIGQDKSFELLKAIEDSEIYLVVFSVNYPFSIECLDELVLVMDTLPKFKKRKVFPIFFNVDPSHVRRQRGGSFMEAFNEHENNGLDPDRVQTWRQVLKDACQLTGLTLQNGVDEAEFILKVIIELEKIQSPQDLHVTDHHVGIESRAKELISKLRLDFRGVLVVAVFGISGIGKTTIVKTVYNRICAEFDVSCFLADIHNHCGGPNWKVDLPKLLISCLNRGDRCSIMHCHNDGVTKIRKFIRGRKILLVLDDVDNFQQLEALGIDPKWFHNGSRIIVTTRDKHSLGYIPYASYHTRLLNRRESLNLFTRLMFAREDVVNNKFVEEVVSRVGGLPLVLKVWSRHFKQFEKEQWPSILETLKRIPHGDIQKQLQMSYDSLPNKSKKLFLDIVFYFVGWGKDFVVKVLLDECSVFSPEIEISCLVDKSLVEIVKKDELFMHHAIREMGQEVVRQENEDDPGKRTRLIGKDVVRVLRDCTGTESVEGIELKSFYMKERVTVKVEALKKMSNLRFIRLYDSDERLSWSSCSKDGVSSFKKKSNLRFHSRGCWSSSFSSNKELPCFSFKNLKYLEWNYFPLKCINTFDMANVVVIMLHFSRLEILWEGFKSLKKLRILDVSYSCSLTKTGDFSGLENLEELRFHECYNLKELHSSFSCLGKLLVLDLHGCRKLKRFPSEMIGKLGSLEKLDFMDCPHIGLERAEVIDSFLSSLKKCCITRLNLGGCKISKISQEVGNLKSLKYLNLSGNRFRSLPDSLCQLHELKDINLSDCTNLKSIPNLPPNIEEVRAYNCIRLVNLPSNMSELQFLTGLDLYDCLKLETEGLIKVSGVRNLRSLRMRNCNVSQVSGEIGNLVSLRQLDLSGNTFSRLPDSFSNLSKLEDLKMNECSELESLPLLPSKLRSIQAKGCGSLNIFPCKLIQKSFVTTQLKIGLSGREIPKWCNYTSNVDELSFVAPRNQQQHLDSKICGVIVCVTFKSNYSTRLTPTMLNKTKETRHRLGDMHFESCSMGVMFYPLNDTTIVVEPGDTLHLHMEKHDLILSFGLCLVYGNEGDILELR